MTEAGANFSFPRNFHTIYCFLHWLLSIFCLTAKTAMSEWFDLCQGWCGGLRAITLVVRMWSVCSRDTAVCSGSGLTPGTGSDQPQPGDTELILARTQLSCLDPRDKARRRTGPGVRVYCPGRRAIVTRPGPAHPRHSGPASAACLADWSRGRATLIGLSLAKLPPSGCSGQTLSITSPQPRPDQLQSLRISAANTASVPPLGRSAQPFTHQ